MVVRSTKASLAKIGVELISWTPFQLQCKTCGHIWKPVRSPWGRLPRGWWKCPQNPDHMHRGH